MKIVLWIKLLLVGFVFSAGAQTSYLNSIAIKNLHIYKKEKKLSIDLQIDLSHMDIHTQHTILFTPALISKQGMTTVDFPAVAVNGKVRDKIQERVRLLEGRSVFSKAPLKTIRRINRTEQIIEYSADIPFENWMDGSQLVLKEVVYACSNCETGKNTLLISEKLCDERVSNKGIIPKYKLAYIIPDAEPVKQRSDTYAARFNYKAGRYELLSDFGNNASELAKVDEIIRKVQNDRDLTLTNLYISGYASPEGSTTNNQFLSEKRADTFARYLVTNYRLNRNQLKIRWYGEDWKGLEEAVSHSNLNDRLAILNIIRTTDNLDSRDALLKKLSGGETYRILLNEYYPLLRRNEYTLSYVARQFNVDEAKKIIQIRPQLLSLNEMFLVAKTYPVNSAAYKSVFDIAAKVYPTDPVAMLNAATAELENGHTEASIERLKKLDTSESWNNLGVAYAKKEQYETAIMYFKKAGSLGNTIAQFNLLQLEQFLDNKEITQNDIN